MSQNDDKLRLLSIFHYIVGAIVAMFSVLALPFLILAYPAALVSRQLNEGGTTPPLGWLFALIGCAQLLIIGTFAALIIAAGRSLANHKRYTFCLVIAVIECLFFPFGTILGAFTLILLTRPPIKQLFGANNPLPPVIPV